MLNIVRINLGGIILARFIRQMKLKPTRSLLTATFCGIVAVSASGVARAVLIDRGGGLIYDTELNVTWLQDTNYANGSMNWSQAVAWTENLSYYDSVRKVVYNDWRLPTTAPVDGNAFKYTSSYNGSTDHGFNISAPGSVYAGS